ncbi:MAG TPA: NUDIX domain-containing protein [Baekduia sp.]|jgi:ADP-ribose pyrophosphatase YjhB (NUDIX family)
MSDREPLTNRVVEAVETRLRARVSTRTLRRAYRAGYLVLRPWWFVTRPRTLGVKVVVRCGEQVLLVRHTYARRDQWDLPGGFLRPGEDPELALRRELGEELGVVPAAVLAIAIVPTRHEHKHERLLAYVADVESMAIVPSEAELADARWVARDALPPGANRLARRLVARAYWDLWEDPDERVVVN